MTNHETTPPIAGEAAELARGGGESGALGLIARLKTRLLSDRGRTKKAYLNAIASGLDYGARVLVSFLLNPILLRGLGSYLFGVWQVLSRVEGYMLAASGRPTEALKWSVANRQSSTDDAAKRQLLGSAIIVWLVFLPLLAVLALAVTWWMPFWLKAPSQHAWVVRVATGIVMVDLVLTSLVGLPEAVLRGENLGYKRMGLTTFLVLFQGVMMAAAVYLKTSLVGVACALLLITLVTAAVFLQVARSSVPWFGVERPAWAEVRQFLGLSGWFLAWRLVKQTMSTSDVVVLGMLLSPEAVTTYTITKYVPEMVISLVSIVMTGITPGLGGLVGTGDLAKVARVRNEFNGGTWLLATVVGGTALLWNRSFVGLWVGHQHYAGLGTQLVIMLSVVQFVLIRNDANIIDLTLDLRHKVLLGAVSAGLAVLLGGVLMRTFHLGIAGLCLGFIAGRLILSVGYPWMIGADLGVPFGSQLKGALRPVALTAALFALTASLSSAWLVKSWPVLVAVVAATVMAIFPLAFVLGLSAQLREQLSRRLRAILPTAG